MEWNDGCLFHRVMLAKRIQVSAKVNVAEGSVKGKAFGVGGNPQSKVREGVETVSAQKTVRKISGLFLTKMSSLVRSGPKALPELLWWAVWALFAAIELSAQGQGLEEPCAGCGTDGWSHQWVPVPPCLFIPPLADLCGCYTPEMGTQRDSMRHRLNSPHYWEGHRLKSRFPCLWLSHHFPVGLEEARWHFVLPAQVVMTDLYGNFYPLSLTILVHRFRQLQEEEMEITETQSGTSEWRGR